MKLISLFEKQDTRTNKTVWGILHTPDKMLLGKRAPGTNNANQWNFFGGFDISSWNVMMRGIFPVIIDSFKSYVKRIKTNAFMTYQQPKHLESNRC